MFGTKKIVVSSPVTDGQEAVDYQIDLPDTTFPPNTAGHFRIYLVGKQVFQLVTIGNNKLVKGSLSTQFFDSFRFGPEALKAAAAKPAATTNPAGSAKSEAKKP